MILSIPLLAAMDLAQAQALTRFAHKRRFRRGESLIVQDQQCNALYILLDGRAHIVRTDPRGREVIIDVLCAGDHIGEMSLIDNLPHSATVRCDRSCDVLILDGASLAGCLPQQPKLAKALMRSLVQRLRNAHRQIAALALYEVPARVALRLQDMSELQANGERLVRHRVSRLEMAKMVGASREMVSRVMRDLTAQGLISLREDGSMWLSPDLTAGSSG
jgi:CRP-like cAMP-binding protein